MYQYSFASKTNHSWLVGIGASANFATSSYASSNTSEGYRNETALLREYGNTFIPGVLLSLGFSQVLENNRALVYSLVYDQNLDSYFPENKFYTDWNFNLGVFVSYLFESRN